MAGSHSRELGPRPRAAELGLGIGNPTRELHGVRTGSLRPASRRGYRSVRRVAGLILALVATMTLVPRGGFALAQTGEFTISLHRGVGYSLGSQVQGTFELRADGSAELGSVAYFIDGVKLGESSEPPFAVRFSTEDYTLGPHELRAEALTGDGREIRSNALLVEFVPQRAALTALRRVIVPGGLVLVAAAASMLLLSLVAGRHRRSRRRAGRAEAPDQTAADAPQVVARPPTPEEELRRRIDESRYTTL